MEWYSLLALIFGASGINQFAANPWMNMLIALIFVIFALISVLWVIYGYSAAFTAGSAKLPVRLTKVCTARP